MLKRSYYLLLLCVICLLSACESLSYYSQAAVGQLSIIRKRQNIEQLIAAPDTDPQLRQTFTTIQAIREFADQALALPVDDNFSTYVDLERPYVVWNVFAAPAYSLQAKRWCYPIAGCVSYRGYFNRGRAYNKARELTEAGWDSYVGGVTAYSTLGWFADPLLNTVIHQESHRLAGLIFHELAHQVLYVKGDTEFNESFATTVEREGLRRWLAADGVHDATVAAILSQADDDSQRQQEFVALIQDAVAQLRQLYATQADEASMALGKARIQAQLREDYQTLKAAWGGNSPYDAWMSGSLNNAQLLTVSTYNALVPAFETLLSDLNGDLPAFYTKIKKLAQLPPNERRKHLPQPPPSRSLQQRDPQPVVVN